MKNGSLPVSTCNLWHLCHLQQLLLNIYSLTEKTLYLSLANQKRLFLEEIRAWTLARWSPLACIWSGWERNTCFFSLGQEFFPLPVAVARQPAKCQDVKPHISLCIVYSDEVQQVKTREFQKEKKSPKKITLSIHNTMMMQQLQIPAHGVERVGTEKPGQCSDIPKQGEHVIGFHHIINSLLRYP